MLLREQAVHCTALPEYFHHADGLDGHSLHRAASRAYQHTAGLPFAALAQSDTAACRNGSVALKNVPTSHYGLLNFTNPADTPNSAGCAVNGLLYQDSAPMQETIGDLMELNLENIDLHPYHHHTQP